MHKKFWWKSEGKGQIGGHKHRWDDNVRTDLGETA
jgi:hypothetical protein